MATQSQVAASDDAAVAKSARDDAERRAAQATVEAYHYAVVTHGIASREADRLLPAYRAARARAVAMARLTAVLGRI